jgi:hypothetical protein
MSGKNGNDSEQVRKGQMSGFENDGNHAERLDFPRSDLGQSYPQHYPYPERAVVREIGARDPLGEPLTIEEVARLLGCSPWTVRQKHMPKGLPRFRSGPHGRLIFYRNQVVLWILEKQKQQERR